MEITVDIGEAPIEGRWGGPEVGNGSGATVEFRGIVRGEEDGRTISALRYEAYESMAAREIERILREEDGRNPCTRAVVRHRHGWIRVGEVAILVWIEARHRAEAFAVLTAFMDRLKRDVPIWKVDAR